jgi:Flp pilus assembly protein TadG
MQQKVLSRRRHHERGQTILLVAISMVSLLAMAALAIDIVTLYVARSEIQRAADAAALSGAKAIADSGFTTLPAADVSYTNAQNLAQSMAVASINAMVTTTATNLVGGQLPVLASPPVFDFTTHLGSYQVTVSLKSASLPTFFSRIWARTSASVTATATAEAYNPANLPTMTPIALKNVKPWLVANADPTQSPPVPFINKNNGNIRPGLANSVVTETFNLTADCQDPGCNLLTNHDPPTATYSLTSPQVDYVPALVADNTQNVCPACAGSNDFEQSIACADVNTYAGPSCGTSTSVTWDSSVKPEGVNGHSADATECLINAQTTGPYGFSGNLQDTLDPNPWPSKPMKITARSGPQNGNFVTTSSSIVTIPIVDTSCTPGPCFPASGQPVTVVGYMQAFINQVNPSPGPPDPGSINITVLNIAGCSSTNNGAAPVVGVSGTSPVPVRLITPP